MFDFEICKNCIGKTTTDLCLNCGKLKVYVAISKIYDFIEAHKSNLSQFILFINEDYIIDVKNALKSNLDSIELRTTKLFDKNEIGIIVDTAELDWGDIFIERRYNDE